jgi:hypothetical protein
VLRKQQLEVEPVRKRQQEVVLDHKQQREVVQDLVRKAPNSGVDRTMRPEAVRTYWQEADRIAEQAGQEAVHTLQPTADRTHPVEAVHTSVVHTHHLDTGSAEEEGQHDRTLVEPDKQGRSRNILVAEQEEVERHRRVVAGIADYSSGTT